MNELERLLAERRSPVPIQAPTVLPSALDLITQLTGKTLAELTEAIATHPEANFAGGNYEEVPDSSELRRVFNLPRRILDLESPEALALTERLTRAMRRPPTQCLPPDMPGGCKSCRGTGTMALKPIQAAALAEVFQIGGLTGPIRVGGGKTLISYLVPQMFSVPSPRPLLVIPAGLRDKTEDSFKELARHWKGPDPNAYKILSYEKLGKEGAGEKLSKTGKVMAPGFLDKYRPTTIVLDEAHKAKNPDAACTARLLRYLYANPEVSLIILSGTLFRRFLRDFGPLTIRALRRLAPVPDSYKDLEAWSGALDVKVSSQRRVQPGPLVELCTPAELATGPDLDSLRAAYGRRFYQTPGVVASSEKELGTSLLYQEVRTQKPDPKVDSHFSHFRASWVTPQGLDVPDSKDFKRHALEMALGFEYHWDPQPPEDWRTVRKAWFKIVRYVLKHNRRNLDSEKQARNAILNGLYPGLEVYKEWQKIEPTFIPNTVSSWFSSEALEFAATWASNNKGLIWVSHTGFALALAKLTGLKYYGRKGKTAEGEYIMEARKAYPAIASVESNKLGRDLQYLWATGLLISPMADGLTWEQFVARKHREGQPEDEVRIDWYCNCTEHLANWAQALEDSRAQERITGQPQKLQYGDKVTLPTPDLSLGRWGKKDEIPE